MNTVRLIVVAVAMVWASGAQAQTQPQAPSTKPGATVDRAELEGSRIIGNRELPKVLYIVPWKKPLSGDLAGRPLVSVIDEALLPVDRDVFRRELNYAAQASAKVAAPVAAPAAAPAAK